MTKLKLIACGFVSTLFLHSCSEVLEPVSFFGDKQGVEAQSVQEDFEINIKSLTFESARDANKAPYPRRLMQTGAGSEANVLDEADLMTSNMPPSSQSNDYLLGIGDQLLYTQLNEFMTSPAQFPTQPTEVDYLLGVGDELTLIQLNEFAGGLGKIISNIPGADVDKNNGNAAEPKPSESVLKTSGLVGTNGNILLLGLGSIKAEGRSLSDVQTEVRNILIRNGLAPSFQLEITGFNSKKAFVTFPNPDKVLGNNIVSITNLPITLKELAITYGLRPSSKDTTIVSLTRGDQKFRMTAGQLFGNKTPRIVIKNRDQIEIDEAALSSTSIEAVVGSRGNILIPGIGSLKAKNRSLAEVQADITRILMEKGLTPNFQLEVTGFESRKFFLVTEDNGSKAIPLTDTVVDLKDAVLSNIETENQTVSQGSGAFKVVELIRNGVSYRMSWQKMLSGGASNVLIEDGDTIKLKDFDYKLGQVFALGGAGNAELVPIDPSKRETLADMLFSEKGALNNLLAKRSEVYLLRGRSPSVAYHLDAQNVSRILVAAQTELRPNDIVYVADRPIISFSRTLAELNPLGILLRDLQNVDNP
ncbi:polysaccharide biosynthesis/export family protein [Planktomarina sp.]|nr:polysaccharide biosynthesis/export family protein [Planktomarina temperata]MDC3222127.1 polysaccharide biosynthesis/export family protein [Planktomarina sp.]